MTERPKISVVLSVFNGQKYLAGSIQSVLDQSFKEYEFLIIDDASSDDSVDILKRFHDPRIIFKRNENNRGLFANLNEMIKKASSPLIKLWAQDDVMYGNCLEEGHKFYLANPDLGCFYVNCDYRDEIRWITEDPPPDDTPVRLSPQIADEYALRYGCLSSNISNLFFSKSIFDNVGYFEENFIAADFEMMVRVQEKFYIGRIPDILLSIRRHHGQWSMNPDNFSRFLIDELSIYEVLKNRILARGCSFDGRRIKSILIRKFAINYFHFAVRALFKGRFLEGQRILNRLRTIQPLSVFALHWLAYFPKRIQRRICRR